MLDSAPEQVVILGSCWNSAFRTLSTPRFHDNMIWVIIDSCRLGYSIVAFCSELSAESKILFNTIPMRALFGQKSLDSSSVKAKLSADGLTGIRYQMYSDNLITSGHPVVVLPTYQTNLEKGGNPFKKWCGIQHHHYGSGNASVAYASTHKPHSNWGSVCGVEDYWHTRKWLKCGTNLT